MIFIFQLFLQTQSIKVSRKNSITNKPFSTQLMPVIKIERYNNTHRQTRTKAKLLRLTKKSKTPIVRSVQELGLETLRSRRWFRKLCLFYKIVNNQSPSYMFDYIPSTDRIYNTRNAANVPRIKPKHNFFKNSYIPSVNGMEWNKLNGMELNGRN